MAPLGRISAGLVVWLVAACSGEQPVESSAPASSVDPGSYVGSSACAGCHGQQYQQWLGSHHHLAMQPASADAVLAPLNQSFDHHGVVTRLFEDEGRLMVRTDSASGDLADFSVLYTFGVYPLQQYLVDAGDGRLQALGAAWDARPERDGGQRWFHVYGDEQIDHNDPLHWTGPGATWNQMCADCHSTNLRKNYDATSATYQTSFDEVSVGCEACHGPGQAHVERGVGMPDHLARAAQVEVCAPCHSRRSQLSDGFRPGNSLFDHYSPSLLETGLYHADGQILDEVYVYGSFLQSAMGDAGVVCGDCHNPHSGQLKLPADQTCTQCHNPAGRADFTNAPRAMFDDASHHLHQVEIACVDCHMPQRTYMQIDPRRDHSFRVPRPDLTVALGVPNACEGCHADRSAQWAADALARVHGAPDAHWGTLIAAGRAGAGAAESGLVQLVGDDSVPAIVRATALTLLAGYQQHQSSVAIEAGLADADPLVRIGALRAARRWPPEQLHAKTRRLLEDELLAVRMEALQGMVGVYPALEPRLQQGLRPRLLDFLQMLAFNADMAPGQSNIASVHLALGEIAEAEAALEQALQINPRWVPGLVNLADLYRATGRDAAGGELLAKALTLSSEQPDVLLAKALWDVRQGDTRAAVSLLQRAWQLDRRNARYAYVYMVALDSVGRTDAALAVADAYLAEREDPQIRRLAGQVAAKIGD